MDSPTVIDASRAVKYAHQLVHKYEIDCTGLTILTEAASGAYLFNPMIPMLAGADRVITFSRNSRYATAETVKQAMLLTYTEVGLSKAYEFHTQLTEELIGVADVVTNSGHLRPFDEAFIERMKSTAVLPLMWEPWELRSGEIDIGAAKRRGILVLGTNEHKPPCDMRIYSFLTAMHLVMSHKASIADDRILVVGDQYSLSQAIEDGFRRLGIACRRVFPGSPAPEVADAVKWATYVLVAEHSFHGLIVGPEGFIETRDLVDSSILGVGVIAGAVDVQSLRAHGVSVFPEQVARPGYMSYLPSELGPYPVMDLFAAGIKVGETMARARLSGLSISDAARKTLSGGLALDLEGGLAWT